MATFSYKASNSSAKIVKGIMEAESEQSAIENLYNQNLIPIDVRPCKNISQKNKNKDSSFKNILASIHFKSVPKSEIANVIRQFSVLLKAKLPIEEALRHLCSYEYSRRMKLCLMEVRANLIAGKSLAQSFEEYSQIFSPTFISLVRAGEESGTLEIVIEQYADHLEKQVHLLRKVKSALAYPLFMLFIGLAIVLFLLTYVVPQISSMFLDMDRALPLSTQILLSTSSFVQKWYIFIIIGFFLCFLSFQIFKKSPRGQKLWCALLLRIPLISPIYKLIIVGQFTRTLGMLLHNEVTLLKALNIVKNISSNIYMVEIIHTMYEGVQEGYDLSYYLDNTLLFAPIVKQMVHAGEKSGKLSDMLLWIAKDSEDIVSTKLQMLTSLLEPLMILVLGLIVGFVVVSIMLPIFEMSNLVV